MNRDRVELDESFSMRAELPGSGNCYTSASAICHPRYGAAFRNAAGRDAFVAGYPIEVTEGWKMLWG